METRGYKTLPFYQQSEIIYDFTAGHSSVKFKLPKEAFGAECLLEEGGEETKVQLVPLFQAEVILTLPEKKPLREGVSQSVACRLVNTTGLWSEWSRWELFETARSHAVPLAIFTAADGPLAENISQFINPNQILWHQTKWWGGEQVWVTANEDGTYKGTSDSILVSQFIDLRTARSVSLKFKHFIQMISFAGYHFDAAQVCVRVVDTGSIPEWKVVAENFRNSSDFELKDVELDLSEYAGRMVQMGFRFHTVGSSIGFGWAVADPTLSVY